jgi:putative Holliday junction resolvase
MIEENKKRSAPNIGRSRQMKKAEKKTLIYLGMDRQDFEQVSNRTSGKILGIDYGNKNVGLAISDQNQRQAFVYDTLKVSQKLFDEIQEICHREEVDKIVVGLPLSLKGDYTDKTNETVCFIEELESRIKAVIVETEDERLSTAEASKSGTGHEINQESARIILQTYLDKQQTANN